MKRMILNLKRVRNLVMRAMLPMQKVKTWKMSNKNLRPMNKLSSNFTKIRASERNSAWKAKASEDITPMCSGKESSRINVLWKSMNKVIDRQR